MPLPDIFTERVELPRGGHLDAFSELVASSPLDSFSLAMNVFCATGAGGGVDPTCSPGEVGSLPAPSSMTFVKSLPGSTAPTLMKDADGKHWVVKTGNLGHQYNEVEADNVYRAMGVKVAKSAMVKGEKVAEFIEGAKPLNSLSSSEREPIHKEIAKNFVLDAVMANWDVVGLQADNILVKDGVPYRIDNGGALAYRAQGALKGAAFGPVVTELKTMRDSYKNPQTAKVYAHLTDKDIKEQTEHVVANKDKILNAIDSETTRSVVAQRIDYLKTTLQHESYSPAQKEIAAKPISTHKFPVASNVEYKGQGGWKVIGHESNGPGIKLHNTTTGVKKIVSPNSLKHSDPAKVPASQAAAPSKIQVSPNASKFPTGSKVQYKGLDGWKVVGHESHANGVFVKHPETGQKKVVSANSIAITGAASPQQKAFAAGEVPKVPTHWGAMSSDFKTTPSSREEHDAYNKALPSDQRAVISWYKGAPYAMNKQMRSCPPKFECLDDSHRKKYESLEKTIQEAPKFSKDTFVVRGIPSSESNNKKMAEALRAAAKNGNPYYQPSITSTSTSVGTAKSFGDGLMFIKRIRTGATLPGEGEIITSPNTPYRVVGVDDSNPKKLKVYLEEIH